MTSFPQMRFSVRSVWICRHLPDSLKQLSPAERKGLPDIHELVLRKLEKEMKKTIETLPEEAVPQEVIYSLSELPSIFRERRRGCEMAELMLEHIYKQFDKNVTAVSDFHLHIKDEEFIVFVGPSGCGKSTTLRMIAGLEEITSGNIYINGERVNDVAPKDRDIAMVFQNYALYPHMTVYGNMAFGLKNRKFPKAEIHERVMNAARILGLEELLDRKPKALSGGQRQRVALGRAIVRDAQVFLMDEPLSNLDAKLRVQMRAEIAMLHQRLKTTTIYVTHDQTEAMTMATRLVVMKDGFIQQIGSPKEVYEYPENVFVGGFHRLTRDEFFRRDRRRRNVYDRRYNTVHS